jgi:AraC family transcriptional activator of pobA
MGRVINIQDKRLPFEIRTFDYLCDYMPEQIDVPCTLSRIEIIWIRESGGACSIDRQKPRDCRNTLHCIGVGQLRELTIDSGAQGYYISFTPAFLYLSDHIEWPLFPPSGRLHSGKRLAFSVDQPLQLLLEEITNKMMDEFNSSRTLKADIIRVLLKLLLLYIKRMVGEMDQPMPPQIRDSIVKSFLGLIETSQKPKNTVFHYAHELGVTPNYLNCRVKQATGYSAKYHINQLTVMQAKRKLMARDSSMKEIAYDLGFEDLTHFSKFFKVNSGTSFMEFKKELKCRS